MYLYKKIGLEKKDIEEMMSGDAMFVIWDILIKNSSDDMFAEVSGDGNIYLCHLDGGNNKIGINLTKILKGIYLIDAEDAEKTCKALEKISIPLRKKLSKYSGKI
jgi:hypothetical protein